MAEGLPNLEELEPEKTLTWPDLVYTELIAMVAQTIFLVIWGIALQAPLEQPASSTVAPNPSKAPWYFLGLQELLKWFHPMVAGVMLPGMGLVGLILAPYVDRNPSNKPENRKFAISLMTMFLMYWAVLVMIGTFFRGPGFNFIFPWNDGLFVEL
jgi:quinol-cytochrome oxidoreductase complex cytochrome b subunit